MAMFYVEKQPWQRWPKVLTVCRNGGDGTERRRYVPERKCGVEWRVDGFGVHTRHCGACGADLDCDTRNRQNYCPNCGVKLEVGQG